MWTEFISCEYYIEISGSMKDGEFLDQLRDLTSFSRRLLLWLHRLIDGYGTDQVHYNIISKCIYV
jgi:hypothetical protein